MILPPDILDRYKVLSHDSEDEDSLIFLGKTRLKDSGLGKSGLFPG